MFDFIMGVALSIPWYIWLIGFIIWLGIHRKQKEKEQITEDYRREMFLEPFELEDGTTDQEVLMWLDVLDRDSRHK